LCKILNMKKAIRKIFVLAVLAACFFATKAFAQSSTVKWVDYTNERYGITLNYPNNFTIDDVSTAEEFLVNIKVTDDLSFTLRAITNINDMDAKTIAGLLHDQIKKTDANLEKYVCTDLDNGEKGVYFFMEGWNDGKVRNLNMLFFKDIPFKSYPGVVLKIKCQSELASDASKIALALINSVKRSHS